MKVQGRKGPLPGVSSFFKQPSWKPHRELPLLFHWPKHSHLVSLSCQGGRLGDVAFYSDQLCGQLKRGVSSHRGQGAGMSGNTCFLHKADP